MVRTGLTGKRLSARGRVEVVGEVLHQPVLRGLAGGRIVTSSDVDPGVRVWADLVPEDDARETSAVRVEVDGATVGYLGRHDAPRYRPVLRELEASGRRGWCEARVTGGALRDYQVVLSLAEPALAVPVNDPPSDAVLAPDAMVTVVGEEAHQDVLAPLLADGEPRTLHLQCLAPRPTESPDESGARVPVTIDGVVVGELTARMSERYGRLVADRLDRHGHATCEAMVHRTPRGVELEVFLPAVRRSAPAPPAPPPGPVGPSGAVRGGPAGPWPGAPDVPLAPVLAPDVEPTTRPGRATRTLVADSDRLATELAHDLGPADVSRQQVRARLDAVLDEQVHARLAALDVHRLTELVDGRVSIAPLQATGIATVADLLGAGDLTRIDGIGPTTAGRLDGAAHQMAALVRDSVPPRFDVDERPDAQGHLLVQLHHHVRLAESEPALRHRAAVVRAVVMADTPQARPAARGFVRRLLARPPDAARASVVRLERLVASSRDERLLDRVGVLFDPADDAAGRDAAWAWFEQDPPAAYALLEELAGVAVDHETQQGHLPDEIVAAVRRQPLDTSFLTASLRGYQSFGARYALVQGRVLIGDEMGLGKTIVALAVAAHLWAGGRRHVLVVCPASVLLNWRREIHTHTTMRSAHLHGGGREAEYARWRRHGGVAVTTFGTLGSLPGPDPADLLVVDEAHYVKNPATQRAGHVIARGRHADRVVYLTGTPLENRVAEFRELVGQLRPDVAEPLDDHFALAGSDAFRTRVAPVYLRRNQEDVLTELPGRLEVDDWVEPTAADETAYRAAVATGNFQAMRRAAWVHAHTGQSAKMRRLAEIVEESTAQGWKVVVFSYFLDPLDAIADRLDAVVFGPLTGATQAADRLALVDAFTAHDGPAVLVSQIVAGGVGLNIQAASVVVLAEPQWKPSTEEQAIARAHRMGQVRRVNVHRLLAAPGVDQRMKELVEQKATIFDEYARQSSLAEAAPDAVDRTEGSMMAQILTEESERLGLERAPVT